MSKNIFAFCLRVIRNEYIFASWLHVTTQIYYKNHKEVEKFLVIGSKFGSSRYLTIKNEPWFVAKDVCDILGIQNSRDTLAKVLDDDEKGVANVYTPGGPQEMATVNESGLYHLIFQSRKPEAKQFRKWVTSEVLPSIQRFGYYIDPNSTLSGKDRKVLLRRYYKELAENITGEDIYKCAKRFRCSEVDVRYVLQGIESNNEIMRHLQECAVANRENHIDAYSDARVREVLEQLK